MDRIEGPLFEGLVVGTHYDRLELVEGPSWCIETTDTILTGSGDEF